jgi:hypothetical protein
MSDRLWQRLGAASGIAYVVLLMAAGTFIGEIGGGATAEANARAVAETANRSSFHVGYAVLMLSFLCFLFFLGYLWSAVRRAEGEHGWLAPVALGGGLMSLTIKLGSAAFIGPALYRASQGLHPQIVQTLQDMDDAAFMLSFFPLVALLAASAIASIRFGALPRWLGWFAACIAPALFIGGVVGEIYHLEDAGLPFLLFLAWTLMASVVLIRRADKPIAAVSSAPASAPPVAS